MLGLPSTTSGQYTRIVNVGEVVGKINQVFLRWGGSQLNGLR